MFRETIKQRIRSLSLHGASLEEGEYLADEGQLVNLLMRNSLETAPDQ